MGLANKICEMFKQNEEATCAGASSACTLGPAPTGDGKKHWYHDAAGKRVVAKEEDVDPARFKKGKKLESKDPLIEYSIEYWDTKRDMHLFTKVCANDEKHLWELLAKSLRIEKSDIYSIRDNSSNEIIYKRAK